MDTNQKLMDHQGEIFLNLEKYKRLVGKLIYLNITRPNISYIVAFVSHFMQNSHIAQWNIVIFILRYIKKTP